MKLRALFAALFSLFSLLFLLSPTVQPAAFGQGKKWAVLVGINKYESESITPLRFAEDDVQSVAERLPTLGFSPEHLFLMTASLPVSDPNRPTSVNLLKRLNRLADLIQPDDTLLLYFSGHGFQRENGRHYLATVNADADSIETLEASAISMTLLQEKLKHLKAKHLFLMIDACRDDPEKGDKGDQENKLTPDFAKRIRSVVSQSGAGAAGSGTLFACSEGERSWEWADKKHGAFTYFLLDGLDGKAADSEGRITMQGLAKYVQSRMPDWCLENNHKQNPVLSSEGAAELLLGQVSRKPNDPKPGGKVNPKDTNAFLDIVTTPVGATVYVEGQPLAGAKTPYRYVREMGLNRQEEIEVGVRMPGYKDAVRLVTLERGNVTTLTLTLVPAPTPKPEPKKPTEPDKKDPNVTSKAEGIKRLLQGRYAEAVPLLRPSAEAGDPRGMALLALAIEGNSETAPPEAVQWFVKAAEKGDALGLNGRAESLEKAGQPEEAKPLFDAAFHKMQSEPNDPIMQVMLGNCYLEGKGVEKDGKKAMLWFEKAAGQGCALAQTVLGASYQSGLIVPQDLTKAIGYYQKSAAQGEAIAQYLLGACYLAGSGVERDPQKAVKWIEKSARQGYAKGETVLGLCYVGGTGVEKNLDTAREWLEKAAAQGDADAKKYLQELN